MRAIILSLVPLLPAALTLSSCGPPPPPPQPPAPPPPLVCDTGTADCDQNRDNGCETKVDTSDKHCGACGQVCGASDACVAGACKRLVPLSVASDHACAITAARGVRCWGDNDGGELGDSTHDVQSTPVDVPGLTDVVAVSTGESLTCALQRSGKVWCWGDSISPEPRAVAGMDDIVSVAAGNRQICAVRKGGEVVCSTTQGTRSKPDDPKPVALVKEAVAVASGRNHTCAIQKNGEVICWGERGLVGIGNRDASDYSTVEPTKVEGLIDDAVQISAGRSHTCVVRKTGAIACWGRNYSGKLGDGTTSERRVPTSVMSITDGVSVAAGSSHTCAVRKGGEVLCWGEGSAGELGNGSKTSSSPEPGAVQGMKDAVYAAAGDGFSCAAHGTGAVSCWGSASHGRLGDGTLMEVPAPHAVQGVDGATMVTLGSGYSCALLRNGTVACWGRGDRSNTTSRRGASPVMVPGLDDVVDLRAEYGLVCATKKGGDVLCFSGAGSDESFQPLLVKGLGPAKAASGSGSTGYALTKLGQVVLWEMKGLSYRSSKPDPLQKMTIAGLSDAAQVAGGDGFVCALRRSGKVGCFRYSTWGTFNKKNPYKPGAVVEVAEIKDAISISATRSDFCVLTKDKKVGCFDGYSMPRPTEEPTKVPGAPFSLPGPKPKPELLRPTWRGELTGAKHVGIGSSFRCGVLESGEVACTGSNTSGQLGAGDLRARPDGSMVKGLSDAAFIAAGSAHACAVRTNGKVTCWGDNGADAVGASNRSNALTPVAVTGFGK